METNPHTRSNVFACGTDRKVILYVSDAAPCRLCPSASDGAGWFRMKQLVGQSVDRLETIGDVFDDAKQQPVTTELLFETVPALRELPAEGCYPREALLISGQWPPPKSQVHFALGPRQQRPMFALEFRFPGDTDDLRNKLASGAVTTSAFREHWSKHAGDQWKYCDLRAGSMLDCTPLNSDSAVVRDYHLLPLHDRAGWCKVGLWVGDSRPPGQVDTGTSEPDGTPGTTLIAAGGGAAIGALAASRLLRPSPPSPVPTPTNPPAIGARCVSR
jgi:hypothetical protein